MDVVIRFPLSQMSLPFSKISRAQYLRKSLTTYVNGSVMKRKNHPKNVLKTEEDKWYIKICPKLFKDSRKTTIVQRKSSIVISKPFFILIDFLFRVQAT